MGSDDKKIRAFVAIDLPGVILADLENVLEALKQKIDDVKWVRGESIHLTLKFLGNIDLDEVDKISDVLTPVFDSSAVIPLTIEGAGVFPNEKKPRVVWIGVSEEGNALEALQRAIDDRLASINYPRETRSFSPHITIGRVKSGINNPARLLPGIFRNIENFKTDTFTADAVHLYRSDLKPGGAAYAKLKTFSLKRE